MKVAIGCDHKGLQLKELAKSILQELGYEYVDKGTFTEERVDYPDYAKEVALAVARGECERGIAICGSGIGVSITANKVPGIRAALCHDTYLARMCRQHNNANVLCLGALDVGLGPAEDILRIWLSTPYEGGRHQVRVDKIAALEKEAHELVK